MHQPHLFCSIRKTQNSKTSLTLLACNSKLCKRKIEVKCAELTKTSDRFFRALTSLMNSRNFSTVMNFPAAAALQRQLPSQLCAKLLKLTLTSQLPDLQALLQPTNFRHHADYS